MVCNKLKAKSKNYSNYELGEGVGAVLLRLLGRCCLHPSGGGREGREPLYLLKPIGGFIKYYYTQTVIGHFNLANNST